MLQTGTKL